MKQNINYMIWIDNTYLGNISDRRLNREDLNVKPCKGCKKIHPKMDLPNPLDVDPGVLNFLGWKKESI